jgi:N utilization substance protein A
MNNQDLLRVVDHISREKNIDKFLVFEDLEMAMLSAARKAYGATEDISVKIDRMNGDIDATLNGEPISMKDLGRIAAQTAKQVMIQKIREAERDSIFEEFAERVGQIVTGTVSRIERGAISVNLGRAEGFLPRSEQIPGETHHPGERIRAMILDVREMPHEVRIVLTRTHPDYIRRLFDLEVPEVGEKIIEIKALAREAGYRTKIAVTSIDAKVDAVGACVGVRGSRIRNIVDELGGEKIDIVRWNESSQVLITNALKPAEVQETALCFELGRATVVVAEDQLVAGDRQTRAKRAPRRAVDRLGHRYRHPGRVQPVARRHGENLREIEGVTDIMLDRLMAMGIISLEDIEEVGAEPLVSELEVEEELANQIVAISAEAAKRLAEEAAAAKELAAAKQAEEEAKAAQEMAAAADALGIGGGSSDADAADGENLDAPSDDAPGVGAESSGSAETEATESAGLTESGGLTESPADPPADARVPGQELAPGQDLAPGQELAPGRES